MPPLATGDSKRPVNGHLPSHARNWRTVIGSSFGRAQRRSSAEAALRQLRETMDEQRAGWQRLVDEQEIDEDVAWTDHLKNARKAASTLQRGVRRQRWFKLLKRIGSGSVNLQANGCCGVTLFPIRDPGGSLIGYEGPSGWCYSQPQHGVCMLPLDSPLRLLCISCVELGAFEPLVLAAIVANCLFLAVQGPPSQHTAGPHADTIELSFTIFFTVEMVLRVGALGLAGHRQAYLADPWNVLDCGVVACAWVELLFPQLNNVSGLRATRALRPLRTINRLPGMRRQVNALLGSLGALADVLLLIAFFFFIAGILGVQLFAGALRRRCTVGNGQLAPGLSGVCADDAACSEGRTCEWHGDNPRDGTLGFDTILQAWMSLSQVVTLEGWTDVAFVLQRVGGVPGGVYVYAVAVLGAFYVLNLLLVVTWQATMTQHAKKPQAVATAAHLVLDAPSAAARARRPAGRTTAGAPTPKAAFANGRHRPARRSWLQASSKKGVSKAGSAQRKSQVARAKWVHSFVGHDPRRQISDFFKPGDHRGPLGYLQDRHLIPDATRTSSYFSVWRPTSMDAIRMMVEGTATGKPLTVKGKSAKTGELSGFVPFLQISEEAHKSKVGPSPRDARIRVFFRTAEASAAVLSAVQPVLREMVQVSGTAEKLLRDEKAGRIELEPDEREAAMQGARWGMAQPEVRTVELYAASGAYGLDMPERLFLQVFMWRADISHEKGWETGRPSEPAFMDLNLLATREPPPPGGAPPSVVWQHDRKRPLNPRGLLVALEEEEIGRVRPVASDFDAFLVGSRGIAFEPLPAEQVKLVRWLIRTIEGVLAEPGGDPWMKRWLDVLAVEAGKGFHPQIPPFGFGDPTSYAIVQSNVHKLSVSGAVRHGAECFNFYFPQALDEEYLCVWEGFEALGSAGAATGQRPAPFRYMGRDGLLQFLSARLDEGFCFPFNPKWLLCDAGWWQLYEKAERSAAAAASLDAWFPQEAGLREQLRAVHEAHPHGFVQQEQQERGKDGEDTGTVMELGVIQLRIKRARQMRRLGMKMIVAAFFYQKLVLVRRRRQCVRYQVVENGIFQGTITGLVVLNVLLMMCERYPEPAGQAALMEKANIGFTAAFTLEMILKLIALGGREYWADHFNRFDCIVVLSSLVEVATEELDLPFNAQALRALRLLRVFKLLKAWTSLQRLLSSLLRAVRPLAWLLLLFALVLFIFALLGMQFFGNRLAPDKWGDSTRPNFDNIGSAMLAVTIVATKEDWNELWLSTIDAVGGICSGYFVALLVVGAYLLMNLLIATLISSFDTTNDDSEEEEDTTSREHVESHDDHHASDSPLPSHPVQRFANSLITKRCHISQDVALSLDTIILVLILVSSGAMALQSCDVDDDSEIAALVGRIDLWSTVVFTLELLLKVLALGLLPYLASRWHQLDALVVITSLLSLFAGSSPTLRVLRVLRVLRPLRLLSVIPSMKHVTVLLLKAAPRVLDVAVLYGLFLVIFAVLGVQLFGGRLSSCTHDGCRASLTRTCMSRAACEEAGAEWLPPAFGSFDNAGAAALLLFEVSTLEKWPRVMFACIDAVGIDSPPTYDAHPIQGLFVIAWVVIGAVCLINLFVGVLVKTFNEMLKHEEKRFATPNQKQWAEAMAVMLALHPRRQARAPTVQWRVRCHALATSTRFEPAILLVILINSLLMALDGYGNPAAMDAALARLNAACTVVFVLEAAVKIGAFHFGEYLREPWNRFDFSIVLLSLVEWVLDLLAAAVGTNATLLRILRFLRVARLMRTLRLVKSAHGLQRLLLMLVSSLPALLNIVSLFLVLLAMYALLGMQLFGGVRDGELVGTDVSFCTFSAAMLALVRCATGEGWNTIMHDLMYDGTRRAADGTACDREGGSCGSWLAVPYLVSFMVLSSFVVLKMLIAVIFERYAAATRRDVQVLHAEHLELLLEVWSRFDPHATGRLPVSRLVELVHALPPPLGLDPADYHHGVVPRACVLAYLVQSDLRCYPTDAGRGEPEVHFAQAVATLSKDAYRHAHARWLPKLGTKRSHRWAEVLPGEQSQLGRQLRTRLRHHRVSISDDRDEDEEGMPVGHHLTASLLQKQWARLLSGRWSKFKRAAVSRQVEPIMATEAGLMA